MNYEPNKKIWDVGDIVIHDADAKREDMLMRIVEIKIEYGREIVKTVYIDKKKRDFGPMKNDIEFLHDPKEFNIKDFKTKLLGSEKRRITHRGNTLKTSSKVLENKSGVLSEKIKENEVYLPRTKQTVSMK